MDKPIKKIPEKVLKNWKSSFIRTAFLIAERKKLKDNFNSIDKKGIK